MPISLFFLRAQHLGATADKQFQIMFTQTVTVERVLAPNVAIDDRLELILTLPQTLSCLTSSFSIPDTWFHFLGNGNGCDNFKNRRMLQVMVRRERRLFPSRCILSTGYAPPNALDRIAIS